MSTDPFVAAATMEGVPSAYSAARDGIDSLIRDRGLRKTSPEATGESLLLGAAATASIEGSAFDVEALRAGAGDATARGAVLLSTELLGLVPIWNRSPLQALARIHSLAAGGSVEVTELGRPVNPAGAARLNQLSRLVGLPTKAPGLVVAALVHGEIAAAAAFSSHNGIVARAAERLVLVAKGVDPASVVPSEVGHAMEAVGYGHALDAYKRGDTSGLLQWLMYSAQSFTRSAEASPLAA